MSSYIANSGSYAHDSGLYAGSALASNSAVAVSSGSVSGNWAPAAPSFATRSFAAPALAATRSFAAPALVATRSFAAPALAAHATNFAVPDNVDAHPLIVRKKPAAPVNYTQQVSVKFLQPPPPQQPGDIVITQQRDVQAAPVAPRLIRQQPPLPVKPAPLIVRERPPLAPAPIAPEHHVIPGKVIPPPPRKVVIERLPQLPQPPQDIIVERWLEYGPRTRRVVFQPAPRLIPAPAPKNVLIQWDSPNVALNRQFRNLGISAANPAQYVAAFGASLVHPSQIPALAQGVKPVGAVLAAEGLPKPVRLVGDVAALNLVNRAAATRQHLAASASFSAPALAVAAPAFSYRSAIAPVSYASGSALASNSAILADSGFAYNSGFASGSHVAASNSAIAASGSLSW